MWHEVQNNQEVLMDNVSLEESILLDSITRLFVIEGPSRCGKTYFLKHLVSKNALRISANLFWESFFFQGDFTYKDTNKELLLYFLTQLYDLEIMSLEDIDYVIGRGEAIQELYADVVHSLTKRYKVIITGIEITRVCNTFLESFPGQYRTIKYTNTNNCEGKKYHDEIKSEC